MSSSVPPATPSSSHVPLKAFVIGVIVIAIGLGAISMIVPLMREQRIAEEIKAVHGKVSFKVLNADGPASLLSFPLPFLKRIDCVELSDADSELPVKLLGELRLLTHLELLTLNGSQIQAEQSQQVNGINQLMNCGRLKNIWLKGKLVNDTTLTLLQLPENLEQLHLYETEVSDIGLERLEGLINLTWLDLRSAPVTGSGLIHLKRLQNLKILDLSSSKLTDDGLKNVAPFLNLEHLCLDWTSVSDEGLEHLKVMSNLRSVTFYNDTQTTRRGRMILRTSLPRCTIGPVP